MRRSSRDCDSSRGALLHLVEQLDVLDGDHRLIGEGLQQLDVVVGERAGLGARHDHQPGCRSVVHQRCQANAPPAA